MNDSWIAVANQSGLKMLVRETPHAAHFLMRRAMRENAECFWAVLQPDHAKFIRLHIEDGTRQEALRWLEHLALDIGRMSMPIPAIVSWPPDA